MNSRTGRIRSRWHRDDRAVSEVVAFVLVFGIILSSIALLSVTGFQAMDDYQEIEQQRNGERAMGALAENFNDVLRYDGIDQRYGELSLRGGTIRTGSGGTAINVSVNGEFIGDRSAFDESGIDGDSLELGEFSYESGSDTLSYEGGAVIRESDGGAVVLEDPLLTYNEETDTAIISLVRIAGDDRSIQSSESTGFTLSVENRTTEVVDDPGTVSVEVPTAESDAKEDAWERTLEDWEVGERDDVDRAVITVVTVDISY
ncbi:hypothetical protein SAMN05444422_104297 [Halobiforma haloterrestris]|uniref:Uncharacterized protein n=1 Tax=Natronobacterium haloterrestre TaxID=148448 RepID=A0A1I1GFM1_NATHA|nr:hypothetical protein [Halobiforma haloterrestris]SFC10617.1 hypothetical protein SAMN05444422_104297 [Halobiforma haloterrestris]